MTKSAQGATTSRAWQEVANNGTLHIIKHGLRYKDDSGNTHNGGGIRLDGANAYDGFGSGAGTDVGYTRPDGSSGPYPLPSRPVGDNITVKLNSCYSSNDPDGAGSQTSVTGTLGGVSGVGSVEGHTGEARTNVQVGYSGGTPSQQTAALNALKAAARAAGYPPQPADGSARPATSGDDVASWIADMPVSSRSTTEQGVIDAAVTPPGTVHLTMTYSKVETAPPPGSSSAAHYMIPSQLPQSTPSYLEYMYRDEMFAAYLGTGPDSFVEPPIFGISMEAQPASPFPSGSIQASGIFNFDMIGGGPAISEFTIMFGYDSSATTPALYRYDTLGEIWIPVTDQVVIDPMLQTVSANTLDDGIYVVLDEPPFNPPSVPALSTAGMALLFVLLAGTVWIVKKRKVCPVRA